jgi:hypothetical protein
VSGNTSLNKVEELDKILAQDEAAKAEEEAQEKALEAKAEEEKKQEDPELKKKAEQLTNLNRAIAEANEELRKTREAKKSTGKSEEEIPKINFEDPSSKAWDKHIKDTVTPLQSEMEQEKSEIFNFTIRKFLEDKPALAADSTKIKEFISMYDRLKNNSGRTQEGVLLDLNKAFAAVYSDELMGQARETTVRKAAGLTMFSEPAVSRGSTSYFKERPYYKLASLTEEDKQIIARMGYSSPEEWAKDKEKYQ